MYLPDHRTPQPVIPISRLLAAGLLGSIVIACSAAGPSGGPSGSPGDSSPRPSASGSGSQRPGASPSQDGLVLRIAADGGFVPPGFIVTRLPQVSVYSDGRLITPGIVTMIYPGPAVSPLLVQQLDAAGLEAVRTAARTAGLEGRDRSYTSAPVADAETTVFTYVDTKGRHSLSIYALGFQPGPGASSDERAARQAANNLVKAVGDIASTAPRAQPFQPAAYRIYATRQPGPSTETPAPNLLDWPAGLPALASLDPGPANLPEARCGVLQGDQATTFGALLSKATQITRYRDGGAEWTLLIRPLLPDEARTCG